jgi:hypothetical protein
LSPPNLCASPTKGGHAVKRHHDMAEMRDMKTILAVAVTLPILIKAEVVELVRRAPRLRRH